MKAKEIFITKPAFFQSFSCTGPACTDNCCHSWEIIIDKASYHRYVKEENPQFRKHCLQTVKKIKDHAAPDRYASLALTEDGRCGFQDEDGGCRIYRLLGPDALSCTCTLYPRRKAQFLPDTWEYSLSLSCEEAARLALFTPNSMDLETTAHTIQEGDPLDAQIPLGIDPDGHYMEPPAYGQVLRQVCAELIQVSDLTLPERLLSVGLLLRKIDQLLAAGEEKQTAAMAVQFFMTVKQGGFKGFFDQLDDQRDAHLAALQLPMAHLFAGARKPVLRHLWAVLEPWCDIDAAGEYLAGERAAAFLKREIKKKADPFVKQHEKAIENYFVSYMFSGLFPFLYYNKGLSFEKHGILLAEQFALLRILIAIYDDIPSDEERLIKAVVTLSRLCQHTDLGQDMEQLTRAVPLDGLAHAAYLLR